MKEKDELEESNQEWMRKHAQFAEILGKI